MKRRIRIGMIGSGKISESHRVAMRLDDRYELVAGVFSRDFEKSKSIASELGVSPDRVYRDHGTMAEAEASRHEGIEAVSIVTPHNSHRSTLDAPGGSQPIDLSRLFGTECSACDLWMPYRSHTATTERGWMRGWRIPQQADRKRKLF